MTYHFRDPIHGMIPIEKGEVAIIQSEPFQRLRHVRQLGTTYLVYHGAEHARFGHSIGVMHLISRAIDCLSRKEPLKQLREHHPDDFQKIRQTARIAALLHDIGHAPFSHVGEKKEFALFPEMKDVDGVIRTGHEVYSHLIIQELLASTIEKEYPYVKAADVVSLLLGTPFNAEQHFICDLLDGQLDVDKMDYLLRDSHYCGVKYGTYDLDRIMDVICLCPTKYGELQLGIDSNGVHAVEELILARYWMFLQVYFHKTRRIYDYYLSHFLKSVCPQYPQTLKEYLTYTDAFFIEKIRINWDTNIWAKHLYTRTHMKEVYVSKPHQADDEELDQIGRLIDDLLVDFAKDIQDHQCYVDQADTSSAKYLINIKRFIDAGEENQEESKRQLPAIPVINKHTGNIEPIQSYSLIIRNISDKKINQFRIYCEEGKKSELEQYISNKLSNIQAQMSAEKEEDIKLEELQKRKLDRDQNKEERLKRYKN